MNKASGGDGIPAELFWILKDDAVQVLHSLCQQIWKTQQCKKVNSHSNPKERQCQRMFKLPCNCFNSTWTMNFQMFKLVLEKVEEAEMKLPTSSGRLNKQESSRKTCTSALLTMPKPLTVWITTNCGKFFKRWDYQTTSPASWEICMQIKKQQLELDMGQQTGSKSGKEYVKAVYCHLAYLTYVQNTSCKRPGWTKHKLESRLPG